MKPHRERLIVIPFIHAFGGVERLALELSRYLHELSLPHAVVCLSDRIGLERYASWPLVVHRVGAPRNAWSEAWRLGRFLERASGSHLKPLLCELRCALYAGIYSPRSYCLFIPDPPSLLRTKAARGVVRSKLVHELTRRGVRNADAVISMTPKLAREVEGLYGVRPVIAPPGVNLSRAAPSRAGDIPDTVELLSVSRLEESKRLDWALLALRDLTASGSPSVTSRWILHIVGAGPDRERIERLATDLKLGDKVMFHGAVSDEDLNQLYDRASVFIMPAVQGYGLPALEALGRRVPVVIHAESGVAEVLDASPWVEVVSGGPPSLAAGIERAIAAVRAGTLRSAPIPHVPSASEWAASVVDVCVWARPQ